MTAEVSAEATVQSGPSLAQLKEGLLLSYLQCSERGLIHSAHWAVELANSIKTACPVPLPPLPHSPLFTSECSQYHLAKSLYDLREFQRAAHTLRGGKSDEAFFLRCYCLYLAGEKAKEDDRVDAIGPEDAGGVENAELLGLKRELVTRASATQLDGFGYYLYGVVLKELSAQDEARKMFLRSVHLTPLLWASWQELAKLCDDREMLYSLEVPHHWLRDFFLAEASLELLLTEDALSYYTNLSLMGFGGSSYINAQLALVNYHLKDFDQAALLFGNLRKMDPYRTSNMDIYSNVLFVLERLPELSKLTQDIVKVDKYRSESCSVIGNFYSLRGDHEKAVLYFQRAVRLNKDDHSAWILLGHEYLEQKNCSMAIEAYTRGLEANKHDFRGYYGMGHTYELLKMPCFALHYYKQAHKLRSSDSRILCALGDCYVQLGQCEEAKKCFKRAVAFKDREGTALIKLAKLHAKLKEDDDAARLYTKFVVQAETSGVGVHLPEEQCYAHLFLAQHHMKRRSYTEAEAHAHKCTEFVATREEGKSLLLEILKLKGVQDSSGKQGVEDLSSIDLDQQISPIT